MKILQIQINFHGYGVQLGPIANISALVQIIAWRRLWVPHWIKGMDIIVFPRKARGEITYRCHVFKLTILNLWSLPMKLHKARVVR